MEEPEEEGEDEGVTQEQPDVSEPPAPEKEEEAPPPKMEEKVLTSPKHEVAPRKGRSETDSGIVKGFSSF